MWSLGYERQIPMSMTSHVTIEPWNIAPEQERTLRKTDATFRWLCALSGEIVRHHAGKWVAAKDCQIVASGVTMDDLLDRLGDTDLQTVVFYRFEKPGVV